MKRIVTILAVLALGLMCCVAGMFSNLDGLFPNGRQSGNACLTGQDLVEDIADTLSAGYEEHQAEHAIAIWATGADRDLPEEAMIIALATAMQESTLQVLANPDVPESLDIDHDGLGEDHDSVGLFQQRQSWGDTADLMDPESSSDLFYDALEDIEDWEGMTVGEAAQAVQISAHPDLYDQHEPPARRVSEALEHASDCEGDWVHPLPGTPLWSGWRTPERPDHNGVDLGADHGTDILAASGGEVVTVTCDARTASGRPYSCDVDGSPQILGCGWYAEIAHPDGTLTRYCHMVERPHVEVGDTVDSGDVIGLVGSSGNSSGPHLHFETHTSHSPTWGTAINPEGFMSERGVDLQ